MVLEIGYGLGKGIYDYAKKYDFTFHGIDFSRLMYSKALKKSRTAGYQAPAYPIKLLTGKIRFLLFLKFMNYAG